MSQNGLSKLNSSIFKRTISPEQINEITWYFACWNKFTKNKRGSKTSWIGKVKNGCGQSGHGSLKLPVSQGWADGMRWFFAWSYKFRKVASIVFG